MNRNSSACGYSSTAIMDENLFNQRYYKSIPTKEKLREELKNDEEGCFHFNINLGIFVNSEAIFDSDTVNIEHAFVLLKYTLKSQRKTHWFDDIDKHSDRCGYQLVQSYIYKYSLADNIQNKIKYFPNFEDLDTELIKPLLSFCETGKIVNNWTEFCEWWYKITDVNFLPRFPLGKIKEERTEIRKGFSVTRTSNYKSILDLNFTTCVSIFNTGLLLALFFVLCKKKRI